MFDFLKRKVVTLEITEWEFSALLDDQNEMFAYQVNLEAQVEKLEDELAEVKDLLTDLLIRDTKVGWTDDEDLDYVFGPLESAELVNNAIIQQRP
jgi:hypothetical protein